MRECWECGAQKSYTQMPNKIDSMNFEFNEDEVYASRCFCEECYKSREAERERDLAEYIRIKNKLMIERAIRCLERQRIDVYEYKDAIDAVSEFAKESPDKFESADEIVAAIILIFNEIETHVQYKIGKYRVDFYLPTLKVVLEIDGHLHKYRKQHDNERDEFIRQSLGEDFEIVRVPTKYIESNADILVEAIKAMRIHKKNERILRFR